jgi:hypothetical protein
VRVETEKASFPKARIKNQCWSYNAGERGENWCRAYEKAKGGIILLEWFETPQDEQGRPLRDPETGKLRVKARESVGHRDRDKAETAAKTKAAELLSGSSTARVMSLRQVLDRYAKEVTPTKKESKRKHDLRAARVFLAYFADRASAGEKERGPERHPSTLDREDWAGFVAARRTGNHQGMGTALPEQPDPVRPEIPAFGPPLGERRGRHRTSLPRPQSVALGTP